MRRLVGLVSTIVVLALLPGANAQAPPHPGTLGVGDETALYVGEASGQGQRDYTRPSDGCGSHFHFTWSAGKLEKPAFSGGGGFALTRGALANASEQSGSGTYVRNPCGDVAGCSVAMSQDQAVGPGVAEFGADGDSVG